MVVDAAYAFTGESLFEALDHHVTQGLAGPTGEFTRQLLCAGIFYVQNGHNFILTHRVPEVKRHKSITRDVHVMGRKTKRAVRSIAPHRP